MNHKTLTIGAVKNLKLHKDRNDKQYYLSLEYEYENDRGKYLIEIPRIDICCEDDSLELEHDYFTRRTHATIGHLQNICLRRVRDNDSDIYREYDHKISTLEEKTHEMTLDEIEKKLGYKVKIVNNK